MFHINSYITHLYSFCLFNVNKHLHPHEMIGKYPTEMTRLNKNSEDVYNEQKDNIKLIVREAKFVLN